MPRGSMNHLALTASDLERSAEFYDRVLGFMGYARVEVPQATQQLMKTRLLAWASQTVRSLCVRSGANPRRAGTTVTRPG